MNSGIQNRFSLLCYIFYKVGEVTLLTYFFFKWDETKYFSPYAYCFIFKSDLLNPNFVEKNSYNSEFFYVRILINYGVMPAWKKNHLFQMTLRVAAWGLKCSIWNKKQISLFSISKEMWPCLEILIFEKMATLWNKKFVFA